MVFGVSWGHHFLFRHPAPVEGLYFVTARAGFACIETWSFMADWEQLLRTH